MFIMTKVISDWVDSRQDPYPWVIEDKTHVLQTFVLLMIAFLISALLPMSYCAHLVPLKDPGEKQSMNLSC